MTRRTQIQCLTRLGPNLSQRLYCKQTRPKNPDAIAPEGLQSHWTGTCKKQTEVLLNANNAHEGLHYV